MDGAGLRAYEQYILSFFLEPSRRFFHMLQKIYVFFWLYIYCQNIDAENIRSKRKIGVYVLRMSLFQNIYLSKNK